MARYDISSGQVSSGIHLNYDSMYISSGGVANRTTVNSGGSMAIYSGGVVNDTTVNGYMYISSGGVANSTTVSGTWAGVGFMYISSGGTALNVTWTPCIGKVYAADGAYVTYTSKYSGVYFGSNNTLSSHTQTMDNKIVSGSMYVMSGGTANDTTVNYGGKMNISSGGTANDTTVNYGGKMNISSGGVANNTTVNGGGHVGGVMCISSGGVANSTTVNSGGNMDISSGGVANSTTVNSGGSMAIYSGGTAFNVTWTPCIGYVSATDGAYVTYTSKYSGVYFGSNNNLLSHTQTMDNKIVSGYRGPMYVMSGGVANSTTVNDGTMHISSGGVANSTTVNSGGWMYIRSGGVANSTTVNSGGWMYIRSGGVANSTTVNSSGGMFISSGGIANSTTVNSGGWMYIYSGGVANSTTVDSGCDMRISSGGTATDITALDGARLGITVASNTYIQGTYNSSAFEMKNAYISGYTINKGHMFIASNGQADNTTVNNGGSMYIYSGGVANSTTVNSGGSMAIYSGGTALEIKENGGYVNVADGANVTFASNTITGLTLSSYTSMTVHKNTIANRTTVNSGSYMFISSGGMANSTTVNFWCFMYISSGGTANSTTVNSGSYMFISSGGVANSTTVNYNGNMYISSGGKHTGTFQMANGAYVSAYEGSIIDFTVVERTVEDDYLINNLSVISGTPTYTITVSANQGRGTYKLAQGASNFSGSITIGDGTTSYGSITVNGEDFIYNGTTYSLDQVNDNLTLTISKFDIVPPAAPTYTVSNTALTNQNVTVFAVFSNDSVVKQFSLNGKDWQTYTAGIVFTANGEVFFRSCDIAGNYSAVVTAVVKEIDDVADKNDTAYIFIKSSFTEKSTKNKKQNDIPLVFGENAFNTLTDFEHSAAYKVVMLDSKVNIDSETDLTEIGTVSSIVIQPKIKNNETLHSYSASSTPKGTLNINGKDTQNVLFKDFTTVNLSNSANVNSIEGGKLTVSETEKSSVKKDVVTQKYSYSKTVAASGKVNISNASAGNISGYATVILDNGTAETLSNADTKISYQRKYVDGIADTITETETYSAKGTATLKNGAYAGNISGFKTVKLTDSFAANIELGDSYTEKFTLKKGVENTVVKETFTGTVTLENSKIGSVCGMNKVTASKGFNFIESYEGSNGNDTLTINKNAVLSLGSIDFKDGAKDKLVNNGTLVLTAEINRGYISGKGEIVACDEVLQSMKYTYGILNLGATADGFRTTKYELADSSAKKAVKWDLKADHQGWLSGDSDCIDTVDFVKFKTGKESSILEICGFSGSDTISLVDKKGNKTELIFSDGIFTAELAAKTDYTLQLGISKGDDSMSYSLAVV